MSCSLVPQLRITVNARCQKACFYCRPAGEASIQSPEYEMSKEEIVSTVSHLARHGITDLKLTGGDPVLRVDIVELVAELKRVPGISSIHLVTRHPHAGPLALSLAEAGLDCLNFSLDTLKRERFKAITGVRSHDALLRSIRQSVPVSRSVKINTVMMAGINDDELPDLIRFSEEVGVDTLKLLDLIVDMSDPGESFAHRLAVVAPGRSFEDLYLPLDQVAAYLSSIATSSNVSTQPGGLGHPMMSFRLASGLVVQVKDARRGAWYGDVCQECPRYPCHDALMALRLTSEGKLQRCLARSDNLLDLLTPVKGGDIDTIDASIAVALGTYQNARFYKRPAMWAQKRYPLQEASG